MFPFPYKNVCYFCTKIRYPMARLHYIIALSLLLFGACRHMDTAPETKETVVFPHMEVPTLFDATIDGEKFLVFVESSSESRVEGHYMPLSEAVSDTLPFRLEAQGQKVKLNFDRKRKTLRPHSAMMDNGHCEGRVRLGFFSTAEFRFDKHELPAFRSFAQGRYHDTLFAVRETGGLPYAQVMGYWAELGDETAVSGKIFQLGKTFNEVPLTLQLDVFEPLDDTLRKRPLVMLIHGGGFYFGSKDDESITRWCEHLSALGYVAVSIDYRLGFPPAKASLERAGYRAVQDAHAAMRYLVAHQEEYGIDTSMIFVGGASAGAITALNLEYMTNENRPECTYGGFLRPDLGSIDTVGNPFRNGFRIKGIVDMWGAMADTAWMRGHSIPVIAFHGDADNIVPYGHGYPFGIAGRLSTLLTEKMYGSSCIVENALRSGAKAHLVTFAGHKHSPHLEPKTKALNDNFYTIQDMMSEFFIGIMDPDQPEIVGEGRFYSVTPRPVATSWQVDGGVILRVKDHVAEVAWIRNAPKHSINVSGAMPRGIGFQKTKTVSITDYN